jgi:DNA invertase Pin-like site-specific DNA recombinase
MKLVKSKNYITFENQKKLISDIKKGKKGKVAIMNNYDISEATYYRFLKSSKTQTEEDYPISSLKRKKMQKPKYIEVIYKNNIRWSL